MKLGSRIFMKEAVAWCGQVCALTASLEQPWRAANLYHQKCWRNFCCLLVVTLKKKTILNSAIILFVRDLKIKIINIPILEDKEIWGRGCREHVNKSRAFIGTWMERSSDQTIFVSATLSNRVRTTTTKADVLCSFLLSSRTVSHIPLGIVWW